MTFEPKTKVKFYGREGVVVERPRGDLMPEDFTRIKTKAYANAIVYVRTADLEER